MSNMQYIISRRNPSKCDPDTLYLCYKKAFPDLCVDADTYWDPEPGAAYIFHSIEMVAGSIKMLLEVGDKDLTVLEKITSYNPVNTEMLDEIMTKNKMREIIDTLDDGDVDFLVKHANLDLTIVT